MQGPSQPPFGGGRFRDLARIGAGSAGVVYRGFDTTRRQPVALKTMPALDAEQLYWLKSEFRTLADVRHRNLVELHELYVDDRGCFFSMELVEGADFVTFVRHLPADAPGDPRSRGARIDDVVAQLVHGIQAIHDAGKLHRDVKPSNVLVTPAGRVVVLDFGLALPIERAADPAERYTFAGSPPYMAPEQAFGETSAATDWYAVGVVLFEALTGHLPFTGSFSDVFLQKQRGAPDVRAYGADLCSDALASLLTALLDPSPARRPGGREILVRLAASAHDDGVAAARGTEQLVGRAGELAVLHECLTEARSATVVVHVQGESGIGKTALLESFATGAARDHGALVIRGRCHPREAVPYKALDGAIDHLTERLLRQHSSDAALLDARSPWLERLFPVVGRLWSEPADTSALPLLEPVEARRAGAEALARLLQIAAAKQPLVLWIDDLQWGDADSAAVLRAMLAGAIPLPMLLVLSYRSEDVARSTLLTEIAALPLEGPGVRVRAMRLAPLAASDAAELAREMLRDAVRELASDIARDAGGSPFFIRELVRHRQAKMMPPSSRLEDIVSGRIARLEADARHLLELISLAATTLTSEDAVDASGRGGDAFSTLRLLESEGFIRLTPLGAAQGVEPFHDRIREAVVAAIDAGTLAQSHRVLAEVLEQSPRRDPESLLTHYLGAANAPAALRNARLAAERAAAALAFERAAAHYRTALDLVDDTDERLALLVDLAEALNSAGRTGAASDRFLEATRLAESRGAPRGQLVKLRRRASECLLRSGRSTEGRELMWTTLRSVDAPLPRSERDALLRATLSRLPLMLGVLPRARARASALDERTRERLEVLWAAAICLSWEPLTASFFRARYIREALPTNDPLLVAAALGAEAASQGALRWRFLRRRGDRLLARMEEIARRLDDPYTTAHAASVRAHNAFFCGRWRDALESGDREIELLRRHCHGVSWELAVAHIFSLLALSFLGEMQTLRTRLDAALRDATERGDQFAIRNLHLGQHNFCRLASDEVDDVLARAEALQRDMPAGRFEVQHYHHVVLVTQCHLYRGDALAAWRAIDDVWRRLEAAQFLQLAFTSVELTHLRARAALALAGDAAALRSRPRGLPSRRELVRLAERASRSIARSDAPPAAPLAAALDAGIARLQGDEERRQLHLAAASAGFLRADMALHAAAARWSAGDGRSPAAGSTATPLTTTQVPLDVLVTRPAAIAATLLPAAGR